MKKTLFISVLALLFSVAANAIQPEEIITSIERVEKLTAIKAPDKSGLSNVDALAGKAAEARNNAISITNTLHKFYYLTGGELPEGVVYVGTPPTLEEVQAVYKQIEGQTKIVSDAAELTVKAGGDLKGAKPMAIGKAKKSMDASKDIFTLVGAETEYETRLAKKVMENMAE